VHGLSGECGQAKATFLKFRIKLIGTVVRLSPVSFHAAIGVYMAIKKLAPESHGAHSYVRNSTLGPLGSISESFIGLPHMEHGSSVV
jgi:hypothetical protein